MTCAKRKTCSFGSLSLGALCALLAANACAGDTCLNPQGDTPLCGERASAATGGSTNTSGNGAAGPAAPGGSATGGKAGTGDGLVAGAAGMGDGNAGAPGTDDGGAGTAGGTAESSAP